MNFKTGRERVASVVWNSLPDSDDFSTLPKFRRSIMRTDFLDFSDVSSVLGFLNVVLLSVLIRSNDKTTVVSACRVWLCLANGPYHCTVCSVLWQYL